VKTLPHLRQLLWLLVLLVGQAQAGEAIDRLNAFFNSRGALRADFVQTVSGAAFAQPEVSRGTLLMQRPGKFRWDYQTPYQQLIVADGKRLWIYDPDLEQVIVKPLGEALGDTPALLLSGGSSVSERFVVTELPEPRDGLRWVQLLPRQSEAGFQELRLGFGPRQLQRMELVDGFGQLTTLEFSNLQENVTLPANSFTFVIPSGVDVVDESAPVKLPPLQQP
jgi:outer membrane lipoprotein carrier protein